MQFAEDKSRAQYHIRSYEPGQLRINDTHYSRSLIISPDDLIPDWPVRLVEDIEAPSLQVILEKKPQILILGTGDQLTFPRPAQLACLYQAGIGVEIMDTAAACRTYSVLVSEDRAVVGALIIG